MLQQQLSNGSDGFRTLDHVNSRLHESQRDTTIDLEADDTFDLDLMGFDDYFPETKLSNPSVSKPSANTFQTTKNQYQTTTSICKSPPSNHAPNLPVPAQDSANKVPSTLSAGFARTADQSVDDSVGPYSPSPSQILSFGPNQDNAISFPASPVQSQAQSSTCRAPPCNQDKWTSAVNLNCPPSSAYSDMLLGESGVVSPGNCSESKINNPAYPVHDTGVAKKNSVHGDEELFNGIDTTECGGTDTMDANELMRGFGNLQVLSQETQPNSQFAASNSRATKIATKSPHHCEVQHVRENVEVQHISNFRRFYFYPLFMPSGRLYKDEKVDVDRCVLYLKENNKTKYKCNHHNCNSDHIFTNKEKCLQHIQQEHFGWEYRCPHPGCTAQITKCHNLIEKHSQTTHDRRMKLTSAKMVRGEWHDYYGPPVEVTMGESNPPPKPRKRQSNVPATPMAGKRMCQHRMM